MTSPGPHEAPRMRTAGGTADMPERLADMPGDGLLHHPELIAGALGDDIAVAEVQDLQAETAGYVSFVLAGAVSGSAELRSAELDDAKVAAAYTALATKPMRGAVPEERIATALHALRVLGNLGISVTGVAATGMPQTAPEAGN